MGEKTLEERRAEARKEVASFKFNKPGIRHAKKDIVCFAYQGSKVDLRTASDQLLEIMAKDPACTVLEQTAKGKEAAESEDDTKKTTGSAKPGSK